MKVLINLIKGFRYSKTNLKMVVMLLVLNFIFSLFLAVPMYHSLKTSLGKSQMGEKMAKGTDYLWWEEFMDKSKGIETTFNPSIVGKGAILNNLEAFIHMRIFKAPPSMLVLGILYIIFHTFLAGGILSIFNQKIRQFSIKKFFEGAAIYFFRFTLLMLISWVFFLAIGIFLNKIFFSILDNVARNSLTEITPFYLGLFFNGIIFFLLLFIQMLFDYARIHIVTKNGHNALRSCMDSFNFIFRNLGSTLGLFYLLFILQAITTVIYILLKSIIPQSALPGVFIAFLLQQLFIFSIIWIRCWLYSSQMELYRYLK